MVVYPTYPGPRAPLKGLYGGYIGIYDIWGLYKGPGTQIIGF